MSSEDYNRSPCSFQNKKYLFCSCSHLINVVHCYAPSEHWRTMASGIKCSVYDSQFKGKMALGEEMAKKVSKMSSNRGETQSCVCMCNGQCT